MLGKISFDQRYFSYRTFQFEINEVIQKCNSGRKNLIDSDVRVKLCCKKDLTKAR